MGFQHHLLRSQPDCHWTSCRPGTCPVQAPFAVHHQGIFAPSRRVTIFPFTSLFLPCPVICCLLSSWRPASNSTFLLGSLLRPHYSLTRPSFSKRLVLRRATTALPTQQTHPHRHRTTTKPRAWSVCNLCSPPASSCHLPADFPTLRFSFADSPSLRENYNHDCPPCLAPQCRPGRRLVSCPS